MEWISHWKNNLYIDLYRLTLLSNSLHTETISEWILQKTGWMETVNFIHNHQLWSKCSKGNISSVLSKVGELDEKKTFSIFTAKNFFCPKFCYLLCLSQTLFNVKKWKWNRWKTWSDIECKTNNFQQNKKIKFYHLLFLDKSNLNIV